eukprot:362781-Chlamydomonas_euryale.AAC.1
MAHINSHCGKRLREPRQVGARTTARQVGARTAARQVAVRTRLGGRESEREWCAGVGCWVWGRLRWAGGGSPPHDIIIIIIDICLPIYSPYTPHILPIYSPYTPHILPIYSIPPKRTA